MDRAGKMTLMASRRGIVSAAVWSLLLLLVVASWGVSYWRYVGVRHFASSAERRVAVSAVTGQISVTYLKSAFTVPAGPEGWHGWTDHVAATAPTQPSVLGFAFHYGHGVYEGSVQRFTVMNARIPHWAVVLLLLIPWFVSVRRLRRPGRPGHCPACGYDLRATPDRCPECGRAAGRGGGETPPNLLAVDRSSPP
jgi:hypothetical protein